jgi:hypothetical protein
MTHLLKRFRTNKPYSHITLKGRKYPIRKRQVNDIKHTKKLFRKGLISRSEYDATLEQIVRE